MAIIRTKRAGDPNYTATITISISNAFNSFSVGLSRILPVDVTVSALVGAFMDNCGGSQVGDLSLPAPIVVTAGDIGNMGAWALTGIETTHGYISGFTINGSSTSPLSIGEFQVTVVLQQCS